jgi:formylmethanofuran dehydrogenase subunit D
MPEMDTKRGMKWAMIACCAVLMAAVAMPAVAQDDDDWDDDVKKTEKKKMEKRQQEAKYRVDPVGWARIAVDYDDDGEVDAVEYISTYELEKARKASRQRRARERGHTLQGTIKEMNTLRLMGVDSPVVIARVETDEGRTAKVALGQENRLGKLNLSEGDMVKVKGHRGTINNKGMLVAGKVMKGDQSVNVKPKRARKMGYVKGEIDSMRTTTFRGREGNFVVAEVNLPAGKMATVQMGREDKLEKLNLSEGDMVHVLGRTGTMNDRKVFIAGMVRANDHTVQVAPKKKK